MARQTFFSFHYDRDVSRAYVVRNSWVTQDRIDAGFFDASLWEDAQTTGSTAVHNLIDEGLKGTSVTVVLLGLETSTREYVQYEIDQSIARGNGLFGVWINAIKNLDGATDAAGANPLPSGYPTYRWVADDGYTNFGSWVEAAAKAAGK